MNINLDYATNFTIEQTLQGMRGYRVKVTEHDMCIHVIDVNSADDGHLWGRRETGHPIFGLAFDDIKEVEVL